MAKDKSGDRKEKKEKKEKRSSADKVSKKEHKKDKKESKEKLIKAVASSDVSAKLLGQIERRDADENVKTDAGGSNDVEMERGDIVVPVVRKEKKEKKEKREKKEKGKAREKVDENEDEEMSEAEDVGVGKPAVVEGGEILVPFARPLADGKVVKKAFKAVKKGAKCRCIRRGVKEVVKSIRKHTPTSSSSSSPHGIVVLAADISPMDVISHIPVLCEDQNVPYIFVQSRAELGAAAGTKRPTSVVMIVPSLAGRKRKSKADDGKEKEKGKGEDAGKDVEGLREAYDELAKAVKALS